MSSDFLDFIRSGFLPEFELDEDRPPHKEDFQDNRPVALSVLNDVSKRIQVFDPRDSIFVLNIIPEILILCGENIDTKSPWVYIEHQKAAKDVICELETVCQSLGSISDILIRHAEYNDLVLQKVLKLLRLKLENRLWSKFPGALDAFIWICSKIKFPDLSQYLHEFLPFALQLTDDWRPYYKIRGTLLLGYITTDSSPEELRWYGRHELITKTFHDLLYNKEPELLHVLIPNMIAFCRKMNPIRNSAEYDEYDKLTHKFLNFMETASTATLKRVYCKYLLSLLEILDVKIIRWFSRIVRIVGYYTEFPDSMDERFRTDALLCLEVVLNVVIKESIQDIFIKYTRDILELLIRLLFEVSKTQHCELFESTVSCLKKLRQIADHQVRVLCDGITDLHVNSTFDKAIKEVMTT